MNICILDNFDSFTFNLKEEFSRPHNVVHIWRNSMKAFEIRDRLMDLAPPRLLVLSPGPGHPKDAGCMLEAIELLKSQVPIFGVCLGLQAIVMACGGVVGPAKNVVHGKAKILEHEGQSIFTGIKHRVHVGRYHSLAAIKVPEELQVFGRSENDVMAIMHKKYAMIGIQFHPESILSTEGSIMINNVLAWARSFS